MDETLLRKLLLTPGETAKLLGVTESTLAKWRTARRYPLAYVKVGGRVGYRRADIERFVASRTVNGTDAPPVDLKAKPHTWRTSRPHVKAGKKARRRAR